MRTLLLILLAISTVSFAQEQKKILFIGNSLTFFNEMPQTIQKMMDEQKINIKIDQSTYNGFDLTDHIKSVIDEEGNRTHLPSNVVSRTVSKLRKERWDIVVLQEPTLSVVNPYTRIIRSEPAFLWFDSVIKLGNAKTLLYQGYTTGDYYFPLKNCENALTIKYFDQEARERYSDTISTKDELQKLYFTKLCTDSFRNSSDEFVEIKLEYDKIAKKINGHVVPVGFAFQLCKIKFPEIPLYENDKSNHASRQGAYLIACVFFKYITGVSLAKTKYNAGLDDMTARKIRALVEYIPLY